MGRALAGRGLTLVFGGGRTGMMGALADEVMEAGGQAVGIIPKAFHTLELAHTRLTELKVVGSMHERKALMAELGDAFVALPGGFGTFEELLEILTWAQIGLHTRPVGVLNVQEYFDPLLTLIEHARAEGFVYDEHRSLLVIDTDPNGLLDRLVAFRPPKGLERWLHRKEETP
jgi:uncharacterized protein (TIGR00730 family)